MFLFVGIKPEKPYSTSCVEREVNPLRVAFPTHSKSVGYHTLISNLACGILYHTRFHSNSSECVGHSKFECVGQSSDQI